MQYIQACLLTKQIFFCCIDAGLEHMAARSRGSGTNFDWLRKSCDISTCDLSPDGNLEKYGRPMKSVIYMFRLLTLYVLMIASFWFDTMNLVWSSVYIEWSQVIISNYCFTYFSDDRF